MSNKSNTSQVNRAGDGWNASFQGLPFFFADSEMLEKAQDILVDTARAIRSNEEGLLRLGADNLRCLTGKLGNGSASASSRMEHWHENTQKAIEHIRAMGDALWGCEWKMLSLTMQNHSKAPSQAAD